MVGDNGMTDVFDESQDAVDYAAYEAYKGFIEIGFDHDEALSLLSIDSNKFHQLVSDNEPFEDDE
jgi:hypothetical protein